MKERKINKFQIVKTYTKIKYAKKTIINLYNY